MDNIDPKQIMLLQQQTLVWNETCVLNMAPGQFKVPLNLIYDKYAEELAFIDNYLGEKRTFIDGFKPTPIYDC